METCQAEPVTTKEREGYTFRKGDGTLLVCTPNFTDGDIAMMYLIMERLNLLDKLYWFGVPSIREFLNFHEKHPTCVCVVKGAESTDYVGLGWVNGETSLGKRFSGEEMTRAEVGICIWGGRDSAGRPNKRSHSFDFGKMLIDYAFEQACPNAQSVIGLTMGFNTTAIRYARWLGLNITGPIPGMCAWNSDVVDGYISSVTREQWEKRNGGAYGRRA